jgi:hypothetical protein
LYDPADDLLDGVVQMRSLAVELSSGDQLEPVALVSLLQRHGQWLADVSARLLTLPPANPLFYDAVAVIEEVTLAAHWLNRTLGDLGEMQQHDVPNTTWPTRGARNCLDKTIETPGTRRRGPEHAARSGTRQPGAPPPPTAGQRWCGCRPAASRRPPCNAKH